MFPLLWTGDACRLRVQVQYWERMRLPVPYVAMEVQAQRDKYRVLIGKVLAVVREYNAIIAAVAADRRLFTDRLRHIDRRVGSGATKLTWNMDHAALDFYQREARRFCREGTASVARFKAGVARVHEACARAADLALVDLSRKGVVQYAEFAETQRARAAAADATLQEIAAEVAGVKDSLYEIFAADGAEVRANACACMHMTTCVYMLSHGADATFLLSAGRWSAHCTRQAVGQTALRPVDGEPRS